ncbi:hypothetical protein BTA51_01235 [Hahella sp. CCB-MM4]|uniref:hypothetical protein n=1 Tax=Hahella sp. (strain CCB-MM4) TaxID=1926491 RepID=UPI000BDAC5C8|nr:hypothetical protein [Hahella sp. CCB-MM4]OZG75051.1 hypothetical protein BTA51_01235 [Hahella sp. CCB-MM4]
MLLFVKLRLFKKEESAMALLFRLYGPKDPKQDDDEPRKSDIPQQEASTEKYSTNPRVEWEMSAVAALRVNFVTSEN